jgi:hypothetical protein
MLVLRARKYSFVPYSLVRGLSRKMGGLTVADATGCTSKFLINAGLGFRISRQTSATQAGPQLPVFVSRVRMPSETSILLASRMS